MEHQDNPTTTHLNAKKKLLILNCILLSIGNCGGPLILRLYFLHGSHRIWLVSFIQTTGWPFISITLIILYFHRRAKYKNSPSISFIYMRHRLFFAAALIGVLTGLDNYLYSYGVARLPISTYALINATRLVFMAFFACLLVKQKLTPYSINGIVLLTIGSVMLAFNASSDRPTGETNSEYVMGFLLTLAAAALYGFVSPLVELTYRKAKQVMTYTLVLEIQMVMCLFATLFCIVGMIFNNDFKVFMREAEDFGLGKTKYYLVLSISVILWQCFFLGAIGVIFYGSSLLLGVIVTVQIPMMQILGVIFYQETFTIDKGVAVVLSLWGFVSYFYGDYKNMKKMKGGTQSSHE